VGTKLSSKFLLRKPMPKIQPKIPPSPKKYMLIKAYIQETHMHSFSISRAALNVICNSLILQTSVTLKVSCVATVKCFSVRYMVLRRIRVLFDPGARYIMGAARIRSVRGGGARWMSAASVNVCCKMTEWPKSLVCPPPAL
jgi:hypothetical protein